MQPYIYIRKDKKANLAEVFTHPEDFYWQINIALERSDGYDYMPVKEWTYTYKGNDLETALKQYNHLLNELSIYATREKETKHHTIEAFNGLQAWTRVYHTKNKQEILKSEFKYTAMELNLFKYQAEVLCPDELLYTPDFKER